MSPAEILTTAADLGVRLFTENGKVYATPAGALPVHVRAAIKEQKAALVAELEPRCYRCDGALEQPTDLLCLPCFRARRPRSVQPPAKPCSCGAWSWASGPAPGTYFCQLCGNYYFGTRRPGAVVPFKRSVA